MTTDTAITNELPSSPPPVRFSYQPSPTAHRRRLLRWPARFACGVCLLACTCIALIRMMTDNWRTAVWLGWLVAVGIYAYVYLAEALSQSSRRAEELRWADTAFDRRSKRR